mgnify:CR=1 FL=1
MSLFGILSQKSAIPFARIHSCHFSAGHPLLILVLQMVAPEEAVPEDTCRSYLIAIGNVSLSEYMSGRIPI